jgi:hypothetical protein
MQLNFFSIFFEGFPDQNLEKAKLLNFPATIFLAANSLKEFLVLKEKLNNINPKIEAAWWPILPESHWLSCFSNTKEIKNLIKELEEREKNEKLKILLDLEIPILNPKLFFKNLPFIFRNKKLIKEIFRRADELNIEIFTFEFPPLPVLKYLFSFLGLSFNLKKFPHKKIVPYYSSMMKPKFLQKIFKKAILKIHRAHKENVLVGLGVIAKGVFDEPILSPDELDADFKFLKEKGINNIAIYRLGGLNQEYLRVIENHLIG